MEFWNRHPILFIVCIVVAIAAAIFALPVIVYCAIAQAIFVAAVFILDLVLPSALTIVAFDVGTDFLNTGIGATIGFLLLVARKVVDLIKWAYIPANVAFFALAFIVAIQQYHDTANSMIAAPGEAWAYFQSSAALQDIFWGAVTIIFAWLLIGSLVESHEITRAAKDGTYVRRVQVPRWLEWAKVENIYGSQTSITPPPSDQPPAATSEPVVQNTHALDRNEWYRQVAEENARQARRQP